MSSETEPQWLNMDARKMDVDVLGQFDVILADPPWDIHMMVRALPFVSRRVIP